MEYHQSELQKHCRICGGRLHSSKAKYKATVYQAEAFCDEIHKAFGVTINNDSPTVHPKSFCKTCKVTMGRLLDARTKGVPYKCSIKVYEWGEHVENCKVVHVVHLISKHKSNKIKYCRIVITLMLC